MRAIVVLALFVLLGVFAWWWFGDRGGPPPAVGPGVAAPGGAVAPGPAAAMAAAPEQPDVAPPAHREIAVAPGPTAAVQVVAFGTNAPVAGAEVRYQPPEFDWQKLTAAEQQELTKLSSDDSEALLARIGRSLIADAEGCCRVPLGQHGAQIIARHGESFGQAWLRADQKDVQQLVLRPDRTLHVLVLDVDGQPAPGIEVQAERAATDKDGGMRWSLGATDAAGRVVKRHLQTFAGDGRAKLTANPPGGSGPTADVDFTAPPPEVVLRLAMTGSVTVRVLEASGAPVDPTYLDEAVISLAAFAKKPIDLNEEFDGFNRNRSKAPIDGQGVATFPRVTMDRYLIVRLGSLTELRRFEGPTAAVPHVATTLQRAADGALVVGRLLGPDGQPFASRKFVVTYRYDRGVGSSGSRTDDQGRFRSYLGTYPVGQNATLQLGTEHSERADPLAVELPPRLMQKGETDLGDVQLAPLRTLVAGRLVPDAGIEVKQVQLEVERRQGRRWSTDHQLHAEWQTDGQFSVRGVAAEGEPLRLVVREGPYAPVDPTEFAAGTTGIEIALRAAAEATAIFLVDENTPTERLVFRFRQKQAAREASDMHARMMERMIGMNARRDEDGKVRHRWTGLVPGTYQLTVVCPGVREPVAALDDVHVRGGPCDDPRLASIDLRGRVRTLHVRATDADGQPIVDSQAVVVLYSPDDECQGFHLGRGVADIVTTAPVDLRVWAPGHRLALVPAVHDDRTIGLQRAAEVRLTVELPAPLPDGVELSLQLVPQLGLHRSAHITLDTGRGMNLDNLFRERVALGTDGTATVTVRCPGEYVVEGLLSSGGRGGYYLRELAPRKLTLGTANASSTATIKVLAAGLDQALQRMRR